MESGKPLRAIGSLNEKPLHAALKQWYAGPGDRFEVPVDGFFIDLVKDDVLVEIQTKNFASITPKLMRLTADHKVRLIHPIAREKWIVKDGANADTNPRRKSPKRGRIEQVFEELVSFPKLLTHPNFSLLAVLIREEELRRHDARRGWRRKGWITHERRLIDVVDQRLFESPVDMAALVPAGLSNPFTTRELAAGLGASLSLAQKMAYCLREMGAIVQSGKRSRSRLYERIR